MEALDYALAFIVVSALGMLWDYYKPARFREGYRSAKKRNDGDSGGAVHHSEDSCGGDGGGD